MTPEPQTTSYRVPATSPLGRAVNAFLLDCEARNLTPGTLRFYWQRLGNFLAFLDGQGVTEPAQMTPALLRTFIAAYASHSPYYQHQHARVARTFCSWLVREELLPASPMRAVRLPKLPKDVLEPFGPGDVARLLDVCECDRDRAIVLTLLDSGVRASELLALDVGDFDALTGALRVRLGKGRKQRVTFVGVQTRKAIARYLTDRGKVGATEPLFVTLTGGTRLQFFGLQSLLQRLGRAAGVKPVGAHRFRRTFAIESLRAGMPLPQLAALMGHEGLAVLQRYLRLVDDDLRAAHEAHGPVARLLNSKGG
jgi:site-specific recombinase XerD